MKKQNIFVFVTVMVLILATGWMCLYIRDNRRLGPAGLKTETRDVYDNKGNLVGNLGVQLPDQVLEYTASTNMAIHVEELQILPADTTFGRRVYMAPDDFGILLSVVMMGTDSRSIHKPEYCLPGQGFKIEKTETVKVPIGSPVPYELAVKKITASKDEKLPNGTTRKRQALYVYWFVAEDALASEHLDRMWQMSKTLLTTGVMQRWSYVATMAYCWPGQEDAVFERMKEFITASVPQFQLTTGKPSATQTAQAEPYQQ